MNITIYGKPNCPQCTMAKNYLDARSVPYDYRELDVDFVREDLMAIAPQARAYPVIFVNGNNVGGFGGLTSALMVENAVPSANPQYLAE